jgi:hypothetical protein
MSETEHTKTPWRATEMDETFLGWIVEGATGHHVTAFLSEANARVIVAAVNAWNDPVALRARAMTLEDQR